MSGTNAGRPKTSSRHIKFSDGSVTVLVNDCNQGVFYSKKYKDEHSKMYANLFLYLPWQNEKEFLGESSRSEEVCQAIWDCVSPSETPFCLSSVFSLTI